jgi:ribosomal protein L7Ae-like RNA K-turn-binding protein
MEHDPFPSRKLLSALGICKKAGKLAEGFDPVAELAQSGKACLILTAGDLSPKSEKEVARIARGARVEHRRIDMTMDEIWSGLGRRAGILAVADEGLAGMVRRTLPGGASSDRANEEE